MTTTETKHKPMSERHKQALAAGREDGRVVRQYLDALESHKPRRGRPVTEETLQKKLTLVEEELAAAGSFDRLLLVQQKMDLEAQLERLQSTDNIKDLEEKFVKVVRDYASRKGISYKAFREVGVPAETLKAAGFSRVA